MSRRGDPRRGSSESEQIDIDFIKGSDSSALATRRALVQKVGSVVTMIIEPPGLRDGSSSLAATGTYCTSAAATIPADYLPIASVAAPWVIEDGVTQQFGLLRVNPDGSVEIFADEAFANFTGACAGYHDGVVSWIVDDFT